jgi:1-phosphofructokinase
MIYTLTMNPARDYVIELDSLIAGGLNRAKSSRLMNATGKGMNVSRVLDTLGVENTALTAPCEPRINVKLHCGPQITEINATATIEPKALAAVREWLGELETGDILIASGSLPNGVPADFYARTAQELSAKGICVIADTSGEALRLVAEEGSAFMIAPNEDEFAEIAEPGVCKCNVLLSMGEKGAKFIGVDGSEHFCPVEQVSENGYTVGAGDTLLAGFVAEYIKSKDFHKALNAGVRLAEEYVCK